MPCDLAPPMTAMPTAAAADPRPSPTADATVAAGWTCPFCSLLCEPGSPPAGSPPRIPGIACPRAQAAMDALAPVDGPPARIDGQALGLSDALDAAAGRLATWRQPLFGGLATDIAGARALYRLAARTGAICDHADGEPLMQGVRAVQDRGQYIATLGEVRSRAELIVFIGTPGTARYPELFRRFGLGEPGSPCAELVFLATPLPADLPAGVTARSLPGTGQLGADLQQLSALVDRRALPAADPDITALADRLLASRYAVLVWEGATLPAEAALAIELIGRTVTTLNRSTRAASFGLGGSDGAFSVNQTLTWLSGLPLRTRVAADGLRHEPRSFGSGRLLAAQAVDGLLWISSFGPNRVPPSTALPRIVLGPPQMAATLGDAADTVFIAVATPGWNAAGHLFRIDGPVVVPLFAARDDGLPGVAEVLGGLAQRIEALS
jgi:formylmethanofuran dehydrogenase subunit B